MLFPKLRICHRHLIQPEIPEPAQSFSQAWQHSLGGERKAQVYVQTSALYHRPSGHQQGDNQENKTPPHTYFITVLCNNPVLTLTSPGLMPRTAKWLLVPGFHNCFTALPPTGRCGTKSVLPLWGPAQKASESTLLCPGVLLPCRSQPQPCKDWHREGSGKGSHHSGFKRR